MPTQLEEPTRQFEEERARWKRREAKLLARIKELERQLKAFDNAHTPSSKQLKAKKRPPKGGKRGRPPGYAGVTMQMPEPDVFLDAQPEVCGSCGSTNLKVKRTYPRNILEVIPGIAVVMRYTVKECRCMDCGETVKPKIPAKGRFGNRVCTMASYLRYRRNMPVRQIRETFMDFYGLGMCGATVKELTERTADEFKPVYEEIHREVVASEVANNDETGWRINGGKFWAWLFATQMLAFYHIDKSRGKKVVEEQMKGFDGIAVTDDWKAYIGLKRQQCWAHLSRRARQLADDREYGAKPLYACLMDIYRTAVKGRATVPELLDAIDAVCMKRGSVEVRKLMRWLQAHKSELFVFVENPAVPPDNNHAERLIRPLVVNRKITGGHRSGRGAESFAIMKSVIETWKLQDRDFFSGALDHLGRPAAGF
jgi:hypothetical protein